MKVVYIHFATSSLNPQSAEILQIGAKANRTSKPLNIYLMPSDEIKPGAIRKHGLTKSKLRSLNALDPSSGYFEFLDYLEFLHDEPNGDIILVRFILNSKT